MKAFKKKQLDMREQLEAADLEQYGNTTLIWVFFFLNPWLPIRYAVSGKEADWTSVTTSKPGVVSVARYIGEEGGEGVMGNVLGLSAWRGGGGGGGVLGSDGVSSFPVTIHIELVKSVFQ